MNSQINRVKELTSLEENSNVPSVHNIFAFASGKGGTGKSFLALNSAYALSQLHYRVLLVDLDFNLSSINILLNYHTNNTLGKYFNSDTPLTDQIVQYSNHLSIIFGDSGSYNFPEINSNLINQFFRELNQIKNQYDFILLDFPSGLDSTILNMFSYSDFCLIVSTTEPISVMDAYAVSKLLKVNEIKAVKLVLINKAKDSAEGEQAFNNIQTAVQHFLKERLIFVGQTFSDSLVTESIINQSLYLKDFPNSQLAHQITSCVKELAKIKQVANSHQPIY